MSARAHDILMITCRRPAYTKMALERLLATCDDTMRVWIWQNGDHPDTLEVIRAFSNHPSFYRLEISSENKQLREPTNWFWSHSDGEYLSKVDDDCLLDDGWARRLVAAHEANPRLGIVAAWRFYDDDFDEPAASRKIRVFNGHRLMLNCWVQGSGYVMKRAVYDDLGPIGPRETFSDYGLRAALRGWVNGWYYPFIHEEHMDDARSPYYPFRTDEEFRANLPLTAVNQGITSLEQWREISRRLARSLQRASPDPRSHVGWRRLRSRIARRIRRLAGNHNFE
ncbi:MAG: glycosyltransferase family 2 protein [Candidatus Sumerlaeia bacterium]